MTNKITQNTLNNAPLFGFETNHCYYHSDRTERWVFNALRIASYFPLVGGISCYFMLTKEINIQEHRIEHLKNGVQQTSGEQEQLENQTAEFRAAHEEFTKVHKQTSDLIDSAKTSNINGDTEQLMRNNSQNLLSVIEQNNTQLLQTAPELLASLEEIKTGRKNLEVDHENHKDTLQRLLKNKQAIIRLFVRFLVSLLCLGVVFLPFDLYHTEWRARNVKVLT